MKKIILALAICQIVQAQTSLTGSAKINAVTVFLNQAQVSSSTKVSIPAGVSKINISNVASTADPNSFQVLGKGDFTILSVKYGQNFLGQKANSVLEDSLEAKQYVREIYLVNLEVIQEEINLVLANKNIKSEKDGVLPEDLKDMDDYFKTKLTELGLKRIQTKKEIKDLEKAIEKLKQQMAQNEENKNIPQGELVVSVSSTKTQSVELNFDYMAWNAGWTPLYDLRIPNTKADLSLMAKANVWQNTGISWPQTKLSLSTGNPSAGGNKPSFYPQFLSIYEPVPVPSRVMYSKRVGQEGIQADQVAEMAVEAPAPAVMASSMADHIEVENTTLAVKYDIKIPYSILSNGQPEMVDIQNFSVPASYTYAAIPKLDQDAFLTAQISDWEKLNILPGQASVYFEGAFVGETSLNTNNLTDTLSVSLGRDKKILIKREVISEYKSKKIARSNVEETFGFKIVARNTKTESVKLTLEDVLPVSQDGRIEVSAEELSGGQVDPTTGKITWKIALTPNETKNIFIKYTVKYPKGKTVNNL